MVDTIKFSQFANGGNLENADTTVGLAGGANAYFNNPWTFMASGTTAERPAVPDPAVNYRLRFNTSLLQYEFYNASGATWVQIDNGGDVTALIARLAAYTAGNGASMIGLQDQTGVLSKTVQDMANATFITQTDNGTLTNAQFLADLSTGILKSTTGTGVLSISAPLTSIDGLVTAADKMIYTTALNVYAVTDLTAYARTLLDDIDAATARATLGLGSAAVVNVPISLANGGTNKALTASNGGIVYSDADSFEILSGTATANQILLSGSSAAPTWSTLTYLATLGVNEIPFASSANVLGAIAAAANGVLVTSAGSVPSISSTLPSAVQNNITELGALIEPLNMNSHQINNVTDPTLDQDAATKAYVDAVARGLNIQASCVCASTTAYTVLYNNGSSGVGATLTNNGALVAFSADGVSPTVGQRVLIKNQASTLQNGIYTVTTVGSGAVAWVLTRATDFDTPSEIQPGDLVPIQSGGTTLGGSSWMQTASVAAVGVDAITFIQFSTSIPVTVPFGGTGLTSVTAHYLMIGNGTSALTLLAPSATAGVPLVSAGAAADPAYGTAVVAGGGSGRTSATEYAVICGGTTTTGAHQSIASVGTAGQVLTSNGAGALPTFQTNTSSTALNLYNTTAVTVTDTTGRVTYPAQPAFFAYLSTTPANTTGDGTNYTVVCDTAVTNVGSYFSTGTGVFTAPVTGLYQFSFYLILNNVGAGHTTATMTLATTATAGTLLITTLNPYVILNVASGVVGFGGTVIVPLTATNTVTPKIVVSGSTKTITITGGAASNTYFSGWLLG